MTKVATRQATAHFVASESNPYDHSTNRMGYLDKIHALQLQHKNSTKSTRKQLFVEMIHCFMQDLCGYPDDFYLVTTSTDNNETAGSGPHVVPVKYSDNATLYWFTSAENVDDLHDLWVKHAQVYLNDPGINDPSRDRATNIIFTNFLVIDGAEKDVRNDAWDLWSASDVRNGNLTRIDLRPFAKDDNLDPQTSVVIEKRLRSIKYQAPPNIIKGPPKLTQL